MKEVNLGIIGLGNEGKLILRNSMQLKDARITAAADLSEKARAAAKNVGIKQIYANYEDMLKNDSIDGVIISLPNFLHSEAALKSAEARKHILLEKPFARTVEEGEEILAAAEKNAIKLMVGYDMRFDPVLIQIHDLIVNGFFGDVQIAEATNISGGPFSPRSDSVGPVKVPSWWLNRDLVGGGALLDLGSHLIDLLIWYFGDVESVECYAKYILRTNLEDSATCLLKFKSGPVATVKVGWFSKGFIQSLQVCGTAKNALFQLAPEATLNIIRQGILHKFGFGQKSPYFFEVQHFADCLNEDVQPQPSGQEALRSLQVISAAYENAKTVT